MRRGTVTTTVIVAIVMSSGMAMLLHTPDGSITFISSQAQFTDQPITNYTIYNPLFTFSRSIMTNFFNQTGISYVSFGDIIQASVPLKRISDFTSAMSILKADFNISYFEDGNFLKFIPGISGSLSVVPAPPYPPAYIAAAYGYGKVYKSGLNGNGETIVIVDAYGDPSLRYDLMAFDQVLNVSPINLTVIYPPGSGPLQQLNSQWSIETATDVEWTHAMAPLAKIVLVLSSDSGNGLINAVSYAISNRLGNVISLSWGTPESQLGTSVINTLSGIFQQAQEENITVFAASGDYGAYDGTSGQTVNFPASDPYVTGVGGTSLYYSASKGWYQQAWGGMTGSSTYGSGGGYSILPSPYWQNAPGINSTNSKRGVPDVAMVGSLQTGVEIIQSGIIKQVGGTSIGTPIWAAIGALLDQANGFDLGSINPMLYQISRTSLYASSFTQITSGGNGVYSASSGWNPVTGLGTPDVSNLINASREIEAPYGTIAIVNSSGYNFSDLSANITLNAPTSQDTFNGSVFYYLSAFYSKSEFVKVGINVSSKGGIMAECQIKLNGYVVSQELPMSFLISYAAPMNDYTIPMSLKISGNNITGTVGREIFNLDYLLSFIGGYQASFGAQVGASEYNLTSINGTCFSDIKIVNGTGKLPLSTVYTEGYSAISSQNAYSSIVISRYDSQYNVSYGTNNPSHYLNGSYTNEHSVVYYLSLDKGISARFSLIGNVSVKSWEVDGIPLTGNIDDFSHGGYYNVTALVQGTGQEIYTRMIYIPSLFNVSVTILNAVKTGYSPVFAGVLDGFYNITDLVSSENIVPTIYGNNELYVTGIGYYANHLSLQSDENTTLEMYPVNSYISLFVFQGNSTVTENNASVSGDNGTYATSISPGNYTIIISSPGYYQFEQNISLNPGQNFSEQVNLSMLEGNYMISGRVEDVNLGFGVRGVSVVERQTAFVSYTNESGYYFIQAPKGTHSFFFNHSLYDTFTSILSVKKNETLNVTLNPGKVQIFSINLNIQRYFPILFFAMYVTWNGYTGNNFSAYDVLVSTTPTFSLGTVTSLTVSNQAQDYAFLSGIYPSHQYYVEVAVHLTDGSIFTSDYITVSYSNLVFLATNIVIVSGTAILVGLLVFPVIRNRKR